MIQERVTHVENYISFLFLLQLSAAGSAPGTAESGMGNKIGGSGGSSSTAPLVGHSEVNQSDNPATHTEGISSNITSRLTSNGEDVEEHVGEVPPPMQPISSIPVKPSDLSCPSGIEKVNEIDKL